MKRKALCFLIAAGLLVNLCACAPFRAIMEKANRDKTPVSSQTDDYIVSEIEDDYETEDGGEEDHYSDDQVMVTTTTTTNASSKVKNTDFVRVRDYIPDIEVEIKYATKYNITGMVIYGFDDAWLRYGTVKKLKKAQEKLKKKGYSLKVWDSFRPTYAQFDLWNACPDPRYVSDPNKGFSSHCRGNAVDVTLVDEDGWEVDMPTGFDDFTALADRDYSDVKNKEAAANAKLLEKTMKECGFKGYSAQWWLYIDTVKYDVDKNFDPADFD